MHRLIRPLIAAAILVASAPMYTASSAPGGDDLAACAAVGDRIDIRKDRWTRISAPKMGSGEGEEVIVDYTAPPKARSRIYMTNGRVIKVSANAGCTWSWMFGGIEQKDRTPGIEQDIFTHVAAPNDDSLWAASYDEISDGVYRPRVYVAVNLGATGLTNATFTEVSHNAPVFGKPVALVPAANAKDVVYLLVEGEPDPTAPDPTAPVRRLYVSRVDSVPPIFSFGLGWEQVPLPAGFSFADGIQPASGRGLWVWQGTKYAYLADSYAEEPSWTVKDAAKTVRGATRIVTIDVSRTSATTLVVDVPQGGTVAARVVGDRVVQAPLPTKVTSFTHGGGPGVYVLSGARGTFGYDVYVQRWVDITPKGVGSFDKVLMPNGGVGRIVLGRAGNAFYRFDTYSGEGFLPPPPGEGGIGDYLDLLPERGLTVPKFVVGDEDEDPLVERVTVEPGELTDVPVTLRVPPVSTPLDVFFLLDTTFSLEASINGLKESIYTISQSLRDALGSQACLGLGEFKDFDGLLGPSPYIRRLPIQCDDPVAKVRAVLDDVKAGGGGDPPEAHTVGLVNAVRGENPAKFRADAFKVIVLVSDSPFKQGGQYPSIDQTIFELNVDDVKVVSVLVGGNGDPVAARADMEQVAIGTSTFAPARGVDCDGNGRRNPWDLLPFAPLVCDTTGSTPSLGPAIIGLLLGVADPGTLAVDVQDDDDVVVEPIKGKTSIIKNLKQQSYLTFAMPVRCSKEQDGQDLTVLLTPSVRARPLGMQGRVIVQCRATPVVPPRVPPPPPEPEVIDPPRPAKPPIAIALPQPPPAPAQPISNINLNAGLSQEEEQQYQLAAVTQGANEENQGEESLELAMSDYRARDELAAGIVLGGASLMTAAAAAAYRRRLRTQRASRAGYVRSR